MVVAHTYGLTVCYFSPTVLLTCFLFSAPRIGSLPPKSEFDHICWIPFLGFYYWRCCMDHHGLIIVGLRVDGTNTAAAAGGCCCKGRTPRIWWEEYHPSLVNRLLTRENMPIIIVVVVRFSTTLLLLPIIPQRQKPPTMLHHYLIDDRLSIQFRTNSSSSRTRHTAGNRRSSIPLRPIPCQGTETFIAWMVDNHWTASTKNIRIRRDYDHTIVLFLLHCFWGRFHRHCCWRVVVCLGKSLSSR